MKCLELINYDNNIKLINTIDVYGEPLLKENIEFVKENGNKAFIKIFATQLSLKLLSSKTITQYYQDGTYKIIPKMDEIKVLIVLIGKDIISNKFELILVATFSEESADCYKRFYNLLKTTYNFVPSIIANDFGLANLKALDEVYDKDDIIIITCLFHFVQSWWRKCIKIGLRKKKYLKSTQMLIFNLELLPFMQYEIANSFYLKLKNNKIFENDLYNLFFEYFEKTWFSPKIGKKKNNKTVKYPFSLWSYFDKFKNKINKDNFYNVDDIEKYISFSNNSCESLNAYIKTFIPLNQNVSVKLFVQTIKNLFIKNSPKRKKMKN